MTQRIATHRDRSLLDGLQTVQQFQNSAADNPLGSPGPEVLDRPRTELVPPDRHFRRARSALTQIKALPAGTG